MAEKLTYEVTNEDLIGGIRDFPLEIVQMMVERQVEQGNRADVTVFQRSATAGDRGFVWANTIEGSEFWSSVIEHRNFSQFFDHFPLSACVKKKKIKLRKPRKGIKWTKTQRWILDRIPHNSNALYDRLYAMRGFFSCREFVKAGFDFPAIPEELEEACNIFDINHGNTFDRRELLANRIYYEVERMRRLLLALSEPASRCTVEVVCYDIADVTELKRYAIGWIKKNLHIAEHFNYIYFSGKGNVVCVYITGKMGHIPNHYTKVDGFYRSGNSILIENLQCRMD